MPSFELSKLQAVTGPKPLSATDRTVAKDTPKDAGETRIGQAQSAERNGVSLEVGASVDTVKPPVDSERVAQIRDALRDGSYPLVPAKIADALIAAQYSYEVDQ